MTNRENERAGSMVPSNPKRSNGARMNMLFVGQAHAVTFWNVAECVAEIAERPPALFLVISRDLALQRAITRGSVSGPANGTRLPMFRTLPGDERGDIGSLRFDGCLFEASALRLQALGHEIALPVGGRLSAVRPRKQALDHP